ncbi:MAG: GNAT family N-acetyltransferase [Aristaeellaceae bacterium]
MPEYRSLQPEDAPALWAFLNRLDGQTAFMMYEPGERVQRTSLAALEEDLRRSLGPGGDFLDAALEDGMIVGYLRAERGAYRRIRHTAYVVTGVLEGYRGRGIGTMLFTRLEQWARSHGVTRLELTVECPNEAARRLYERQGFTVEGLRRQAMLVDGQPVDEYAMARLL